MLAVRKNIHTFLAQDSVLSTVLGSTDYLVMSTIEEWPICSVRQLAPALRTP